MFNAMCNVDKIEVYSDRGVGRLFLPKDHIPDMNSTISSFLDIDPELTVISTYIDEGLDTTYIKAVDGVWEAVHSGSGR